MPISNFYNDNQKKILLAKVLECTNDSASLTKRNPKEIQSWIDKNQLYYEAESGEIRGWVVREPLGNSVVELKALYVLPEYRDKGIANNLMGAVSKERGVNYICATRTAETHNILKHNGFIETKLLSLPAATLFYYLVSRKFISVSGFLGNKTTFWYKNAN